MVERFTIDWEYDHGTPRLVRISTPTGPFVQHSDYATLEAEVSRLTALLDEAKGMARPFSSMAGEMFARGWDASNVAIALDNPDDPHRVTAGDFFAARAFAEKAGA